MSNLIKNSSVMDIRQLMNALPHRYPMLLVDKIVELELGKRVVGIKNVTFNEEFFQGHFPGIPMMPGVLITEAMAQTSAISFLADPNFKDVIPVLGSIDNAKFRKPVVPGDQLRMEMEILWFRNSIGKVQGKAYVEEQLVASVELTCKFVQREK